MDRQLILPHLIERWARETPDRQFIRNVQGRSLSYGEFHRDVLQWAAAFQRLGVRKGETVVTMLPTDIDSHLAWLGCSWIGAIEVPVNTMNRGRLLEYIIKDSQARVVVIAGRYLDQFVEVAASLDNVETVVLWEHSGDHDALPMRVV